MDHQKTHIQVCGVYHVECYDAQGNLKWVDDAPNALYDEGEFAILDIALRNGTAPSAWYIGLLRNSLSSAPAESTTLSTIPVSTHEPQNSTEGGYSARQQVNRDNTSNGWPSLVLDAGDYKATSKTVTWTATSDWPTPIRWIFLTTNGVVGDTTGKLISLAQLSVDRTLLNGDSLNITYSMKLQ
jgi:hypothetical protein